MALIGFLQLVFIEIQQIGESSKIVFTVTHV